MSYPFRSALVTGASSGIGEQMVHLLADDGVDVVAVARREDRLRKLAEQHATVEVLAADLTDADDLERVAERVGDEASPIDLVVNNAGFGTSGSFADVDVGRLADEVALNCGALTRLSHAALAAMVPRGRGYLLNVSSLISFQPAPKLAVYAASKAYVTNLSESLHEEVKGDGVHVTALCPGLTPTEFQSVSSTESYSEKYPGFAWTNAVDVARQGLADVAKNRALSIPGVVNKSIAAASAVTPRGVLRRISGLVQRD
ncbi:MAG: SDR family oxidoreductase [Actinomycetota bacterium]|nr:SDR family oxidoreductase [Actinomycetota bacterium]